MVRWCTPWRAGMAVALVAALLAGDSARGQSAWVKRGRERRVALFDFEERPGNPNPLPLHWYAIGRRARTSNPNFDRFPLHQHLTARPGFPRYTFVGFDEARSVSGAHSLRLGLNGGNVGAFLEVGALPAVENSDYVVTASVRTEGLRRARAHLATFFVDRTGRRIPGSVTATDPLDTRGQWQTVRLRLFGDFAEAAWIGLQMELRQPQADPGSPLGDRQLVLEDIEGSAWFDDIALWQLPRLEVRSQSPVNIVRAPQRPQLDLQVIDLTGRALIADVTVHDERLGIVARSSRRVGSAAEWRWEPPLPRFGWYLVDMQVRDDDPGGAAGGSVARKIAALLWLGAEEDLTPADAPRFGVIAEGMPDRHVELLPDLMDAASLDAVVLSAWRPGTTVDRIDRRQAWLDGVVQRLLRRPRRLMISLDPIPTTLARRLDRRRPSSLDLFDLALEDLRPYLAPVLMRHSQHVHDWVVGPAEGDRLFYDPQLPQAIDQARLQMGSMASRPRLVLPWHVNQARREDVSRPESGTTAFLVTVPAAVHPDRMADYMSLWSAAPAPAFDLRFEAAPADVLDHGRRVEDLALRMLHTWEAGAVGMWLSRPWTAMSDRNRALLPDPLLGVFTTVAHRLAGRRVVGRLPLGDGLRCVILDGERGGMLVAWNESAGPADAEVNIYLGNDPVAVDVWGNRSPLVLSEGRHRLTLTAQPRFVEGIDPELALFRAAFRIDPGFVESKQVLHKHTLTLTNPWPRTINGQMRIIEPAAWQIQPQRTVFALSPGQALAVPVVIRFPLWEVAGPKTMVARFDFMADRSYRVDLSTALELGLKDIDFDATLSLQREPDSGRVDAVVRSLITNRGKDTVSLKAFAFLPDFPRQEQPIQAVRPERSVSRTFRFAGVTAPLEDLAIRVGLRELAGPAMLNRVLRP